ncbi:MAG: glucose-6-phosphate isomerase, partial [Deinococcales bacterium]
MPPLTESPAWTRLEHHHAEIESLHMRDLFARDPQRFQRFHLRLDDILFDFSKNRITEETMQLLY